MLALIDPLAQTFWRIACTIELTREVEYIHVYSYICVQTDQQNAKTRADIKDRHDGQSCRAHVDPYLTVLTDAYGIRVVL